MKAQLQQPSLRVEAYEQYLKAKYFIEQTYVVSRTEADFQKALQMLQKAVELDPNYAIGYTGFVDLYELHWTHGSKDDLLQMEYYANKSYQLNPNILETARAVGWVLFRKGQYDKAFPYLKQALEMNPNDSRSNHALGAFSARQGLYHQSIKYYTRAIELDPLYLISRNTRAIVYKNTGQHEKSKQDYLKLLELEPDDIMLYANLAEVSLLERNYKQADEYLLRVEQTMKNNDFVRWLRSVYYAALGNKSKSLEIEKSDFAYILLNMKEEAITALEQRIKAHNSTYMYLILTSQSIYDSLRNEPRFQRIVAAQKQFYDANLKKYKL